MRTDWLFAVVAAVWACGFTVAPAHADSSKAKQRAEAGDRADALFREGKFADAVEPAALSLRLSKELDGAAHWRTFDAEHRLKRAEAAAALPARQQAVLRDALTAEADAVALEGEKPADGLRRAAAALDGYRGVLGEETVEAGRVLHLIGRMRVSLKDTRGAVEANTQALAARRKALPARHPDIGRSLNNLGLSLRKAKNLRAAGEHLEEAVAIFRASLGRDDLLTAMGLSNLADVRLDQGNFPEAVRGYQAVLAIRRKLLPADDPSIAFTFESLAEAQAAGEEFKAAVASYEEALAIRRKAPNPDEEAIAFVLEGLGLTQIDLEDYAGARKSYEEALALRRRATPPDRRAVASAIYSLGRVEKAVKDYGRARRRFEEAVAESRQLQPPDKGQLADSVRGLAEVQVKLEDFAGAEKNVKEALDVYRAVDPEGKPVLFCLWTLGRAQKGLRQLADAEKTCEEALALSRKGAAPDELEVTLCLVDLATVQSERGEYPAAKANFARGLATLRNRRSSRDLLIASLNDYGLMQVSLQDFAAARTTFGDVLTLLKTVKVRDPAAEARALAGLGLARYGLREVAEARAAEESALALLRGLDPPKPKVAATALGCLGRIQTDLGDYAGARKSLEEAIAFARKASAADEQVGSATAHLGALALMQGDAAGARKHLEDAVALFRRALHPNHPDLGDTLVELAQAQMRLQDFRAARTTLEEALAIYRKAIPPGDPRFADVYASLGIALSSGQNLLDYLAARKNVDEALAIRRKLLPADHPNVGLSLLLAGLVCYGEGDTGTAVARLGEAADVFLADQLRHALAQSEQEQFNTTGLAQHALDLLLTAAGRPEADPAAVYDRLVRIKGLVTAHQGWVRQLRDGSDPETGRLLARLRQVTRELVAVSAAPESGATGLVTRDAVPRIQALAAERNELERKISQRSPAFRSLQAQAHVGTAEVRAALPADAALVDFVEYMHLQLATKGQTAVRFEKRLAAFVIRPDQSKIQLVPLGPSAAISGLVARWRASYGAGKLPPTGEPDPGVQLRKQVWERLEPHLAGASVVVLSPDGPLHGLPFAALPGAEAGSYLLDRYVFAVAPVPQTLPALLGKGRPASAAGPAALVVGNVDFGVEAGNFPPLPGTEAEAREVGALYRATPGGQVTELSGEAATKAAFVAAAGKHSHLLVATHGFFVPDRGDTGDAPNSGERSVRSLLLNPVAAAENPAVRSGLVFAGGNRSAVGQGEAFLTALEVGELDLRRATLVVLSACETGLGRARRADGVIGLQRAFHLAGARTTVASLWKVPDQATRALMVRFHANLLGGRDGKPLARGEALREAQRWLITEWVAKNQEAVRSGLTPEGQRVWKPGDPVPPYFWAAFVLSGDWR